MTAMAQAAAGSRLTAGMAQGAAPLSAYKATAQPGTSGSTLADDSALSVTLQAASTYYFELTIGYEGGALGSSDIQLGWALPSGATMGYTVSGMTTGGVAVPGPWETESSVVALGTNGSGVAVGAVLAGTVTTSTDGGTMQLQWARNASSGTSPTVLAGSSLEAWQSQ